MTKRRMTGTEFEALWRMGESRQMTDDQADALLDSEIGRQMFLALDPFGTDGGCPGRQWRSMAGAFQHPGDVAELVQRRVFGEITAGEVPAAETGAAACR
jgi:hypothetical protein